MSSGYSGVYAHIGGYVVGGIYYYYMYGKQQSQLINQNLDIESNYYQNHDDILDKIGQSGYESLSDEEKNFLSKKGDNK